MGFRYDTYLKVIEIESHIADISAILENLSAQVTSLDTKIAQIITKEDVMAQDLTALTNQVKSNTDAEQSAITLLNGLSAQIAALKNDPVAIQGLADQLKASADQLGAAIVANTPAA